MAKESKLNMRSLFDRSAEDLYRFWRNVENLPTFMRNLESVRVLNDGRSHWVVRAPAGKTVEWDAEIHNEIENELIAWRSLEGADINNAGSVHFRRLPDGRTEVKADHELRAAIRPVRLGDRKASRRGSGSTTSRRFVAFQTDDGNWWTQRRDQAEVDMKRNSKRVQWGMGLVLGLTAGMVLSQETSPKKSSYAPVAIEKDFATVMAEMKRAKPELAKRHLALLEERYILTNQAESQVTMFRGKPIQKGVRAKLPAGTHMGIV